MQLRNTKRKRMKEVMEMPRLGKNVCAYVGRKAMMADRSLFTESFHITSGRSVLEKEGSRLGMWHGLMSEAGRASCTTELVLTVLRIVRREPMKGRNL